MGLDDNKEVNNSGSVVHLRDVSDDEEEEEEEEILPRITSRHPSIWRSIY